MTGDDPNKAYEVVPIEPGQHGPPHAWWTASGTAFRLDTFPATKLSYTRLIQNIEQALLPGGRG
jgi:hypothetical protein